MEDLCGTLCGNTVRQHCAARRIRTPQNKGCLEPAEIKKVPVFGACAAQCAADR